MVLVLNWQTTRGRSDSKGTINTNKTNCYIQITWRFHSISKVRNSILKTVKFDLKLKNIKSKKEKKTKVSKRYQQNSWTGNNWNLLPSSPLSHQHYILLNMTLICTDREYTFDPPLNYRRGVVKNIQFLFFSQSLHICHKNDCAKTCSKNKKLTMSFFAFSTEIFDDVRNNTCYNLKKYNSRALSMKYQTRKLLFPLLARLKSKLI